MERKCKRESFGGVFEDSETPRRKRLRVEYLDETSSLDILIEDLSANQSPSPEETSCKQALPMVTPRKRSTIGRFPTPCRDKDAIIYNRRSSAKQSKFSTCSEPKYDGEVDKVLMRMKDCFEEVSKLLKAKDNENKMLKRSTTRTQGEEQLNPEEGESFSSRLKEELEDLKRQKEHWDENQNRLRNENKKLRDELEKKTADIENNLLEMVGQSKEMNSLRGQIRTLEEEKKRRKNEEKSGKVWACISVKPLSQLISNEQADPSNSEATEERSDLDDVVIPMKVVDDDLGSIVHEEEGDVATNSISQTGEDARDSAQEEPAFAMPVEAVGERIKSEKEADLPEVVIDKVVPGKELVKIENPEVAAIDEALDEEEKEVEELQRILDQEEEEARQKEAEMVRQKEKQMNFDQEKEEETRRKEAEERQENFKQKDSECQSEGQRYWEEEGGSMVERCPEKEKRLEKDASLEKEVQQEKEKENDCAAEKENSLLNKSANGSMLDEGGREENESEDEFVDLLEEEDFEDVEEDEDDVEELDTSGVLEEVERELDILEERQVRPTSQIRSSTEKETCQSEIERPIVIQGEEELLQEDVGDDLLQEVGGDHLVSGWVSCPLCSASFLKVTPIDRFIHNILLTLFCLLIFF